MKTCTKCNIQKIKSEFGKDKNSNDGLGYWCKKCSTNQSANYRKKLVNQIGREKLLRIRREKYAKNKDHVNKLRAARQKLRRKHFNEQTKKWQRNNPDKVKNSKKKYKSKPENKNKIKEYNKEYKSRKNVKKRRLVILKKRLVSDPYFKLQYTLRKYIADGLRNYLNLGIKISKKEKSNQLLGCSIKYYKNYIENQFKEGMNWNNWGRGDGKWNIDHIKPIASFNLNITKERTKAFNYKNTKPMWSHENVKKSSFWKGKKYFIKNQL